MDSLLVVNQMSQIWKIKHEAMRPLASEAAALVRQFRRVGFRHIPRELNKHADRLAHEAMGDAARGPARGARGGGAPPGPHPQPTPRPPPPPPRGRAPRG